MLLVKYRKIFYGIAALLALASIVSILVFGLHLGIDFKGGSILEVSYQEAVPDKTLLESRLASIGLHGFSLRQTGETGFILRSETLTEEGRGTIIEALSLNGEFLVAQERFTTVGPIIGEELRTKAFIAIAVVIFAIILFITFAFRKVSQPVSSWKYGLVAITTLVFDVLIPIGAFAALGYVIGAEVDSLFVMALLAILGYSVHDTIVVFDRVRENLRLNQQSSRTEDFELVVGKSLAQTYVRSINTSMTTALALLALFFFGPGATENFALVLLVGVIIGTYSSIALASPLLVTIQKSSQRDR